MFGFRTGVAEIGAYSDVSRPEASRHRPLQELDTYIYFLGFRIELE